MFPTPSMQDSSYTKRSSHKVTQSWDCLPSQGLECRDNTIVEAIVEWTGKHTCQTNRTTQLHAVIMSQHYNKTHHNPIQPVTLVTQAYLATGYLFISLPIRVYISKYWKVESSNCMLIYSDANTTLNSDWYLNTSQHKPNNHGKHACF